MRKRSGKPGASHLIALQNAHGKGDYESSRRAALAYANECTKHCKASHPGESHADATAMIGKASPAPDRRAQLAKLAMSRRKASA